MLSRCNWYFLLQNGSEDGDCNYSRWCTNYVIEERDTNVKYKRKTYSFVNRKEMEDGRKIISDMDKLVKIQ